MTATARNPSALHALFSHTLPRDMLLTIAQNLQSGDTGIADLLLAQKNLCPEARYHTVRHYVWRECNGNAPAEHALATPFELQLLTWLEGLSWRIYTPEDEKDLHEFGIHAFELPEGRREILHALMKAQLQAGEEFHIPGLQTLLACASTV